MPRRALTIPVVGALLVVLVACGGGDAPATRASTAATSATTAATVATSASTTVGTGVMPEGFERVRAQVTGADGEVCELCVWLADTPERRARGLMGVTDLGQAEAMAFVYPSPTTTTFWMKDTILALSIAFFAADGTFLASFDMAPCERDPCPSYPTAAQFTVAVEVPDGGLDELLMVEGSTLELLDLPCE